MKKKVNTMLDDETIELLNQEAKEKSISVSAIIRQKVEASYKYSDMSDLHGVSPLKEFLKPLINKTDPEFGTGNN